MSGLSYNQSVINKLLFILTIFFSITSVLAAESEGFVPPRIIKTPVVIIPDSWSQQYSPSEVLVQLNILPDSSATLIRIIDPKPELLSYVNSALKDVKFIPAMLNGDPTDAVMTIKLRIERDATLNDKALETEPADSLRQFDNLYINNWINRRRIESQRSLLFSSKADSLYRTHPQIYDTFYRMNYFQMGINNHPYLVLKDGYIEPAPVYYSAMQYQLLSNFRELNLEGNVLKFANRPYTQPVLCTDVQAALGDYEFNFARGIVNKNHLFGLQNLYTEFGFLVQNGYWQQSISDQTSTRLFLSYPILNSTICFDLESYNQNFPSTQLLPAWQNYSIFAVGQKWTELYLGWQNPYINIGYRNRTESLSNSAYLRKSYFKKQTLKLDRVVNSEFARIEMTYQFEKSDNAVRTPSFNNLSQTGKHALLASAENTWSKVNYSTQILGTDKGVGYLSGSLSYPVGQHQIGIEANYNKTQIDTVSTSSMYLADNTRSLDSFGFRKSVAVNLLSNSGFRDLIYSLRLGTREYLDSAQYSSGMFVAFVEGYLDYHRQYCGVSGNLQQTMSVNTPSNSMLELPALQYQTNIIIQKELPYNNALSAGMTLTGHSEYNLGLKPYPKIYANAIADAWVGVKITRLFEFRVVMNNLGNNTLYGLYPSPRTLMGTVHWFYLN